MEKITDFFKDLRDRLSNPLFSSFIIAWILINWRVPIGLFFYNNDSLKVDGYKSYIDLIASKYSFWNYFISPLLFALVYTFAFPFMRNLILAFQAWIKRWGNDLNLKISRRGKVSMEKYIQLRTKYYTQTKTLEELFLDEGKYLEENKELKVEKAKLSTQVNSLTTDLNTWQTFNDSLILNGEWDYITKTPEGGIQNNYRLSIQKNMVFVYPDASKKNIIEQYNIQDFFCNPRDSRMCFTLHPTKANTKSIFHNLQFPNGITELYGTEDFNLQIIYKKLKE